MENSLKKLIYSIYVCPSYILFGNVCPQVKFQNNFLELENFEIFIEGHHLLEYQPHTTLPSVIFLLWKSFRKNWKKVYNLSTQEFGRKIGFGGK